jgi:hypothetical protein
LIGVNVCIAADKDLFVASFEKLALGMVVGIKPLVAHAVDVAHAPGDVSIRALD